MKTPLTLTILFFSTLALGQKSKSYLVSYVDSTSGQELIGFKSRNGEIIIKAKYSSTYTDTMYTMALVLKNGDWVGIDRNEKVILEAYIYDNGPDYVEEGLFRFVENNKVGFANLDGHKIIKAQYDFAIPFEDGISQYYIGGEKIYDGAKTAKQIKEENGSFGDRHWIWGGHITESGYLNKSGQKFEKVSEIKNNKRHAWTLNNKHVLLNKNGEIIKTFTK